MPLTQPGLLPERLNRLADPVFVGCAVGYEVSGTLIIPARAARAVRLGEACPGHRFGAGDDAGFQRPVADLATVAAKQPGVSGLRLTAGASHKVAAWAGA